jgi:hypothetical protein
MFNKTNVVIIALFVSMSTMTLSALNLLCFNPAQAAPEHVLPQSVTVLGQSLVLKDTQGGGPGQKFIAEYIPKDETFDNWTSMFASRFVPGTDLDPKASAEATAERIMDRKEKGDAMANAMVLEAPDGKSIVVDFLLSEGNIIEHNIFRYFQAAKGLVSLQIARRVYQNAANDQQVKDFIVSIKTERSSFLKEIMRSDLPVSNGAN